jgi:hypothetical protein
MLQHKNERSKCFSEKILPANAPKYRWQRLVCQAFRWNKGITYPFAGADYRQKK